MASDPDVEAAVRAIEPAGRLVGDVELTGGVSARVLRLEIETPGGRRRAAVFRQHGAQVAKEHGAAVAAKEFALLELLAGSGVPVTSPLALHGETTVGGPWLVTEFVDGTTPVEAAGSAVAFDQDDVLDQMVTALVAIHAVALGTAQVPGLAPLEDPRDHLGLDVERRPNPSGLVHADYWPGNVLFDRSRLVAVLDWEDAHLGDPLIDLAVARVELTCAYGDAAARSFTERYLERTAVDTFDLALWELYVASTALASMHRWGLEPDDEAVRRAATTRCEERASAELLSRRGSG